MARKPDPARRTPIQGRSRQTVEAVLEAAAQVFDERGFAGGTTERIAARAGVSVGSMYQYFPNKEALLVALAERRVQDAQRQQRALLARIEADDLGLEAALRACIDFVVAIHGPRTSLQCLLFEEADLPPRLRDAMAAMHAEIAQALAGLLARRGLAADDARRKALVAHHAVASLVHRFVLHPHDALPPHRAAEEVFDLAWRYLSPSP